MSQGVAIENWFVSASQGVAIQNTWSTRPPVCPLVSTSALHFLLVSCESSNDA